MDVHDLAALSDLQETRSESIEAQPGPLNLPGATVRTLRNSRGRGSGWELRNTRVRSTARRLDWSGNGASAAFRSWSSRPHISENQEKVCDRGSRGRGGISGLVSNDRDAAVAPGRVGS